MFSEELKHGPPMLERLCASRVYLLLYLLAIALPVWSSCAA